MRDLWAALQGNHNFQDAYLYSEIWTDVHFLGGYATRSENRNGQKSSEVS